MISDNKPIYLHIIEKLINTFSKENLGFVIGATHPNELKDLRQIIPNNIILIPGVGAQGADIEQVITANNSASESNNAPAIINVSRAIIYPKIENNDFDNSIKQTTLFYKNAFNYLI